MPPLVGLTRVDASPLLVLMVCVGRLLGMNSGLQLKLRLLRGLRSSMFGTLLALMTLRVTVQ